jgi:hypothetical protein
MTIEIVQTVLASAFCREESLQVLPQCGRTATGSPLRLRKDSTLPDSRTVLGCECALHERQST